MNPEQYKCFSKFARPCAKCGANTFRELCDKCDPLDIAGVVRPYRQSASQLVFTYALLQAAVRSRGRVTSTAALDLQQSRRERVLELEWLALERDRLAKGLGIPFYPQPEIAT